jgi:hypothetical protein
VVPGLRAAPPKGWTAAAAASSRRAPRLGDSDFIPAAPTTICSVPSDPLSEPRCVVGLSSKENSAYERVKDQVFLGAKRGRFDVGISDEETSNVLDAFAPLEPREYLNVIMALGTNKQRPEDDSTFLDTLVIHGVADLLNLEMTNRFWNQAKEKLSALATTPQKELVPMLRPLAKQKLMGKVHFEQID